MRKGAAFNILRAASIKVFVGPAARKRLSGEDCSTAEMLDERISGKLRDQFRRMLSYPPADRTRDSSRRRADGRATSRAIKRNVDAATEGLRAAQPGVTTTRGGDFASEIEIGRTEPRTRLRVVIAIERDVDYYSPGYPLPRGSNLRRGFLELRRARGAPFGFTAPLYRARDFAWRAKSTLCAAAATAGAPSRARESFN